MSSSSDPQWRFHDPTSSSSHTISPSTSSSCTVSITSGARTDWWTTAPGSQPESSAHRTTGPVVYQSVSLPDSASFRLSGILSQPGTERFQQTTLFIQRQHAGTSGIQGQLWLKAGVENEGGRQYVGVVATNPYSDWNVSPLANGGAGGKRVKIEIEKTGPDVHVYYTVVAGDGKEEDAERFLLREKKGLAVPVDGEEHEEWWIGAMVCGPLSEATQGTVDEWTFDILPEGHQH
ncbi:hypothetical protein PHSY_005568 [Pseudozyma hubeiensis SY62]|uniref:Uncharacterized protein n=1 Tax=Pseudozyma hubeiensis (strain SY62) TaxID=1305764 RepID=R9PIQ3_PSEHS|nr:hypothetical protein PHSY_005568 [Pseudozyma hubeiensis SY62]GAC97980.1 hypothetical protein PHSY_005568 [Pseudozyma hubeiensis SY62]